MKTSSKSLILSIFLCIPVSLMAESQDLPAQQTLQAKIDARTEQLLERLRQEYQDQFKSEQNSLMQRFYQLTGWSEQKFLAFMNENRSDIIQLCRGYPQSGFPIERTHVLYQMAKPFLEKANIDPQTVILYYDPQAYYWMASSPGRILISPRFFNNPNDPFCKATLAHECAHLKVDDSIFRHSFERALAGKPNEQRFSAGQFLESWHNFKELRAEVTAALSNIENCQLLHSFYQPYRFIPFGLGPEYNKRIGIAHEKMKACRQQAEREILAEQQAKQGVIHTVKSSFNRALLVSCLKKLVVTTCLASVGCILAAD